MRSRRPNRSAPPSPGLASPNALSRSTAARKSTRLTSSPEISSLPLRDALPISLLMILARNDAITPPESIRTAFARAGEPKRLVEIDGSSEEHTSDLQSRDLLSSPTRRSSDLAVDDPRPKRCDHAARIDPQRLRQGWRAQTPCRDRR